MKNTRFKVEKMYLNGALLKPPTTYQPTHRPHTKYQQTHRPLNPRPIDWLSSIYVKIEARF